MTLSISNPVPSPKPDSGQLTGLFAVTRSGDVAPSVLVSYTTQDGTGPHGAHAETDYVATSGTLVFAPYQLTATITVPILGNNIFQEDKTFTVSLSSPLSGVDFAPPATFTTGVKPLAVAVGDFNDDGKPDLAVVSPGGNGTVSVLLNTTPTGVTTPTFTPQQPFGVGPRPYSVAVGDLNGDGKTDLAVANYSSDTVSVLLNTTAPGSTTASFTPQQTFATGSGPDAVAVGDFNGDGKPDLVAGNGGTSLRVGRTASVLLNTTPVGATTASFAPQQSFTTGANPVSVAVGDFNGDGKPDFAVTNYGYSFSLGMTVSVLLNTTPTGATTASFAPQQTFGTGTSPVSVAVGDFNGDGKPDLAVANARVATVSVLLNATPAGATTASFAPQRTFATNNGPWSVAVDDFNGDSSPDLVVADLSSATLSVLMNTALPGATVASFASQQVFIIGGRPNAIAVGDFNGDGKPDLAVTASFPVYPDSAVAVLLNTLVPITPAPNFGAPQTFGTGDHPSSVAAGDFNGDGKPDLAIPNESSNSVSVLVNTTPVGSTTPSFAPQQTFTVGSPVGAAVGDFNGDGKPDIAVVATMDTYAVSVLVNTTPAGATTPSFAPRQTFSILGGGILSPLVIGDFNGDGKPDVAVANHSRNAVSVLLNTTPTGATTLSFTPLRTFATTGFPSSTAVGDFNGDGKPDLAVGSDIGVEVLLNTTPIGATTPAFTPARSFVTGGGAFWVAVGDFNGNGKPDVVVVNEGDPRFGTPSSVSVLLNTTPVGATTPSFAPSQTFATARQHVAVAVGDFTGDGKADLAISNYFDGTVSVLLNTTPIGATTPSFSPDWVFRVGANAAVLGVGDFNGDGRPDLAVTNAGRNTIAVLLNNSAPILLNGSPALGTISSAVNTPVAIVAVAGTTPQSAVVTTAFTRPPAVDVRNAAGHSVQGVSVTFTAPGSGVSGSFGGNNSVMVLTDASGRATAPVFVANTLAGSYMVTAQATGGSNPSASFSLTNTPAAASSFALTDVPASLTAGTPSMLTVTARDPFNNIATGYTGTVHLLSTDPNATLPADYTFTAADNGVHTFTGLILQTAGTRYVIASDTVDPRIVGVSAGVRVVAAAADHFAVTTGAADPQTAGTPFDVSVTVQDAYGNTVIGYSGTVTFSSADPYGATLPDDYTFQPTDQGIATFPGGATLYTAGTWDVTATDTVSGITGAAFVNVTAAPAVAFQVIAPADAAPGVAFDVTVVAVDPYGNIDTHYTGTVTFSSSDDDPGVVLPADYTFQPADAGVVTFAGGVTLWTPGDQILDVTDTLSGIAGGATVTVSDTGPRTRRKAGWGTSFVTEAGRSIRLLGEAARIEGLDLVFQTLRHRRPEDGWALDLIDSPALRFEIPANARE